MTKDLFEIHSYVRYSNAEPVSFLMQDGATWTIDRTLAGKFSHHDIKKLIVSQQIAGVHVYRLATVNSVTNASRWL
jgi:hypothetical protein